jgi:hypothetical protein
MKIQLKKKENTKKMKTLFWLRSRKTQKSIQLRIILNNEQLNFSTGILIDANDWLGNDLLCNPINMQLIGYNTRLTKMRMKVNHIYDEMINDGLEPTPKMIVDKFQDPNPNKPTTPARIPNIAFTLDRVIETKKAQLDTRIGKATYKRYIRFIEHFEDFLRIEKLKKTEPVTRIDNILVIKFFSYLIKDKNYAIGYVNKFRDFLYVFVDVCERQYNGSWRLDFNMRDFRTIPQPPQELIYLEADEKLKIYNAEFKGTLAKARDIFVMLIESGLHVADYRKFINTGVLMKDVEGNDWVTIYRQKNQARIDVHLSATIKHMIMKYGGINRLPAMADQKLNDHLKIIALRLNIDKHLTTKVGRKTFAHTLLNDLKLNRDEASTRLGIRTTTLPVYGQMQKPRLLSPLEKNCIILDLNQNQRLTA